MILDFVIGFYDFNVYTNFYFIKLPHCQLRKKEDAQGTFECMDDAKDSTNTLGLSRHV